MTLKEDKYEYGQENAPALNAGGTKGLTTVINKLQKEFGETVQIGDAKKAVDTISTGSLALDIATGIGGYPRGRITQIAGWESAGKTTHALKAIANVQRAGGTAVFIDTEYALDPMWAERQGVNMEDLTWLQIDDLETAGEAAIDLADSGMVDMIIFDSIAGAPIKAIVSGDLGDSNMGKRAKLMSDAMTKLNGPVARNNVWMIFTNQLRDSLDPYKPKPVRPGGHAIGFHASMIIDIRSKREKNSKGDPSYIDIKAVVEKNKLAAPGRTAEYVMDFDGIIDPVSELTKIVTNNDLLGQLDIVRTGAWYTFPQELFPDMKEAKFQGQPKIYEALTEVDALDRVTAYVKERLL